MRFRLQNRKLADHYSTDFIPLLLKGIERGLPINFFSAMIYGDVMNYEDPWRLGSFLHHTQDVIGQAGRRIWKSSDVVTKKMAIKASLWQLNSNLNSGWHMQRTEA